MRKVDLPIRVRHVPRRVQQVWNELVNRFPRPNDGTDADIGLPADPFFMLHVPDFRKAGRDCVLDEEGIIRKGRSFLEAIELSEQLDRAKAASTMRHYELQKQLAEENGGILPDLAPDVLVKSDDRYLTGSLGTLISTDRPLLRSRVTGTTSPKADFIVAEVRVRWLLFYVCG